MILCTGNVPWSVGTSCAKDVQLHRADPAATADIQSSKTSVFKGMIFTILSTLYERIGLLDKAVDYDTPSYLCFIIRTFLSRIKNLTRNYQKSLYS